MPHIFICLYNAYYTTLIKACNSSTCRGGCNKTCISYLATKFYPSTSISTHIHHLNIIHHPKIVHKIINIHIISNPPFSSSKSSSQASRKNSITSTYYPIFHHHNFPHLPHYPSYNHTQSIITYTFSRDTHQSSHFSI